MQLNWTDLANADLDHVEAYITHENSVVVAIDIVLRIIDSIEMILPNHPEAGRFLGRLLPAARGRRHRPGHGALLPQLLDLARPSRPSVAETNG